MGGGSLNVTIKIVKAFYARYRTEESLEVSDDAIDNDERSDIFADGQLFLPSL